MKIRELTLCGIFVALLCITAFIKIPTPLVPITLQSQVVLLSGLLLGPRLGCTAPLIYMLLGLLGLPVFTGGGGLGYVLQPSFGYILGFLPAAWLTGRLVHRSKTSLSRLFCATFSGLAMIYLCGMGYYYTVGNFLISSPVGLWPLFMNFCLIFLPADLILSSFCALLARRLLPLIQK